MAVRFVGMFPVFALWDKMQLIEKSLSGIDDKASALSDSGMSVYNLYTGEKAPY